MMPRILLLALGALVTTSLAQAKPGEYWETTTKTEMAGMPMAMPATTIKVCVPSGAERAPQQSPGCEYNGFTNEGNRSTWKVTCTQQGTVMTGVGEATYSNNASDGKMRMTGTSSGQKFDMTMSFSSKRIGGACDTDDEARKLKAQGDKMKAQADARVAQMCETKGFTTQQWVSRASMFTDGKTCGADKKQALCEVLKRDMPRDAQAFVQFAQGERSTNGSLARACGLDVAVLTKTACSSLNGQNFGMLAPYCPAEARVYRAAQRRKACEGRSYTAKTDLSKCLTNAAAADAREEQPSGAPSAAGTAGPAQKPGGNAGTSNAGGSNAGAGSTGTKSAAGAAAANATGKRPAAPPPDDAPPDDDGAKWAQKGNPTKPTDAAVENAKKLKGLFGL